MRQRHIKASLTASDSGLVLVCDYHAGLVAWIKSLPVSERAWNGQAWVIHPKHGQAVADKVMQFLYEPVTVPMSQLVTGGVATDTLEVRYIGTCKEQPSGEAVAFGYSNEAWSVVFPESVLRKWFHVSDNDPVFAGSLYEVLTISKSASQVDIKKAYRQLSRQWHPDVCQEPDANERFLRISRAYEVLGDMTMRQKYDAGLALQATLESNGYKTVTFRAPIRCGMIRARYEVSVGRKVIQEILAWDDIVAGNKVLVTSWPRNGAHFIENWVEVNGG